MGSWKMCLVSKCAILHFHDYGRKGTICSHFWGDSSPKRHSLWKEFTYPWRSPLTFPRLTSPIVLKKQSAKHCSTLGRCASADVILTASREDEPQVKLLLGITPCKQQKQTSVPMDASNHHKTLPFFTTSHLFPFKSLNIWIWIRGEGRKNRKHFLDFLAQLAQLFHHGVQKTPSEAHRTNRNKVTISRQLFTRKVTSESGPFQHSCSSSSPPDQDWDLQITKRTE